MRAARRWLGGEPTRISFQAIAHFISKSRRCDRRQVPVVEPGVSHDKRTGCRLHRNMCLSLTLVPLLNTSQSFVDKEKRLALGRVRRLRALIVARGRYEM